MNAGMNADLETDMRTDADGGGERSGAGTQAAPDQRGRWLSLGLPWRPAFWERLRPLTLLRLNPHWSLAPGPGPTWDVEDLLLERRFAVDPAFVARAEAWSASFPNLGLRLEAVSRADGADTALRWDLEPAAGGAGLSTEEAGSNLRYWLPSLREYYRLYESDGLKHRFWRLFMNRVMLTMNPAQRRTCSFIFKFTLLELLLIVVLLTAYFRFIAK